MISIIIAGLLLGMSLSPDAAPATLPKAEASAELKPDKSRQTRAAYFDRPMALAAARKSGQAAPVIVLLTSDPWLMAIGSDSPSFALYEDGTVIYATKSGFKSAKLAGAELEAMRRAYADPELAALSGAYEADLATDQPDNDLLVYGAERPFFISVYGSFTRVGQRLPGAIWSAYARLRAFDPPNAVDWLPEKIEVMIWPYEYAPEESIKWPQEWPGLDDPATRKRRDAYSIFLPSSELDKLNVFLAARKQKGAVEIGGKKWAVSFRMPFAHENLWMGPRTE
ncbi:hypothetical protein DAH66_10455 [Sphingomonas koreensis]|uniref:Uncharacterized protein n=1 Tax=Sphingomonas koreensis TaxID=93064 RepID=A0A430G3L6_9SPHN|nr:hypothetical protein [Sphingomonas koreensis]RSY85481.1 hypothetical protein DAH66_10455 [Sphingomonas koreensis]